MSRCFQILFFLLWTSSMYSQNSRITGKITDAQGQAIISANVIIDASKGLAAVSDYDGNYVIDIPVGGVYKISYRAIGMQEIIQEVAISPGETQVWDAVLKKSGSYVRKVNPTGNPIESNQGIKFQTDKKFEELLYTAKTQNKLLFIDCYTTWCGPCKRLSSQVFPDVNVAKFFNANFINSKFDMEINEGLAVANKYDIRAYPTLLWIDANGSVIHKLVGGTDAEGLIAQGKKALSNGSYTDNSITTAESKIVWSNIESYPTSNVATTSIVKPAILSVIDIKFKDENLNDRIDGNEKCSICFTILNQGKGSAQSVKAVAQNISAVKGLNLESAYIGNIEPNTTKKSCLNVNGSFSLSSGTSKIKISFEEKNGFQPDPIELSVETKEFVKPEIVVADHSFLSDNGSIRLGLPVQLKALIQNVGQGTGENVSVQFTYPGQNVFPNSESQFNIGTMKAGERRELLFEFIANKLYSAKDISIGIKCSEKYGTYAEQKSVSTIIDAKSSGSTVTIASNAEDVKQVTFERGSLSAEVDKNIPVSSVTKANTYALIIGNEDYSTYQSGLSKEVNVDYALNDARIFKEYCNKTLGIPEKQIKLLTNATAAQMNQGIAWLANLSKVEGGKAEILFYYSGHGLPDEATKEPYLIPVDVSGNNVTQGIQLSDLYAKLNENPSQKVSVFLDACFSGGARNYSLVAMKGVKVKPKDNVLTGNMVVFTSSSGEESSAVYREKMHGYMTYFLLKKLQETKGDVTYSQLADYIVQNVKKETALTGKIQTPQVNFSSNAQVVWGEWKIK